MSEEELYKLLNIPNKPWIELTDEEKHLFEKNDIYIENLHQQLKDKDEKISKVINYIKNEFDYFDGEIEDEIDNVPFKYVMETDINDLLKILESEEK